MDEFETHPKTGHEEDTSDVQRLVAETQSIDLDELCSDQMLCYNRENFQEWIITDTTVRIEA